MTTKSESTKSESTLTGLFDQAVRSFGDAIKTGVKLQEDTTRWWSDALEKSGPLSDWQKRSLAGVTEAIPAARKNTEEWLRVLEVNYHKSVGLLKKAFEAKDAQTAADLQSRIQQLWEGSMVLARDSAQSMAIINVKMMETFADLLRKSTNGVTPSKQGA